MLKLKSINSEASVAFLPSDHIILDDQEFSETLSLALNFTSKYDGLVTLGIEPTRADRGYGYLEISEDSHYGSNILKVKKFHEKPRAELTEIYFNSDRFYWNAGVFVSNVSFLYRESEKSLSVYCVPCKCGWSDLGTWLSLHKLLDKDDHGNSTNIKRAYPY